MMKRLLVLILTLNVLLLSTLGYIGYTILTIPTAQPERIMLPVDTSNRNDGLVLMYDRDTRQVYNITVCNGSK